MVCHNDLYTVTTLTVGGWVGNVVVFTGDTMPRWPSVDIDRTRVIRVDDISDKGNNLLLLHMESDTPKTLFFPIFKLLLSYSIVLHASRSCRITFRMIFRQKNSEKKFCIPCSFPFVHINVLNFSNLHIKSEYFKEIWENIFTNCPYTRYNQF